MPVSLSKQLLRGQHRSGTVTVSSANAILLGGMGGFSCTETNHAVPAAIRGQGQPTEEGGTSAFIPYNLTSREAQRVALAETCAVPIAHKSPFTAKRTGPELFPKPLNPSVIPCPSSTSPPVPAAPAGDPLTVAAAAGASLCRCHAALNWPFRRGPS